MSCTSLNNSNDIIAHIISVVSADGKAYVDLHQLLNNISGSPPTDLSNLEQIASSINNDAFYYETVNQQLNNISNTLNTKLNISDNNVTVTSLLSEINKRQYNISPVEPLMFNLNLENPNMELIEQPKSE